MEHLPYDLYTTAQVRELDRIAVEERGIPGSELMERAGQAAFALLRERWPAARRIAVYCGAGNNGGDGYVVARLALEAGLVPEIIAIGTPVAGGAAAAARDAALRAGVRVRAFESASPEADLVVDGLLGSGARGEVRERWRAAIGAINEAGLPVLALDIPSGLDVDTGMALGAAVKARLTVTFIGLKQGLFTAEGVDLCGEVAFADLGLPREIYARVTPAAKRLEPVGLQGLLPRRSRNSHKGMFGHVLVVGGEQGMSGAAAMAARAAARVGAGLVSVATRAGHAPLMSIAQPEIMAQGVEEPGRLKPLLERANVVALGPGLGRGAWGRAMMARVLESHLPVVLDADGLTLLSEEPVRRTGWVLTPHPGEAARLLGCSVREIQQDRFRAAAALQASFGGVCVLKGAGSLVVDEDGIPFVCGSGNPGMATGGMGDVLTGVIAGLLAQGLSAADSARLGTCLHGRAGDIAARGGERGMLATDLLPHIRALANPN